MSISALQADARLDIGLICCLKLAVGHADIHHKYQNAADRAPPEQQAASDGRQKT
jgi:hypothetical protein